jgi:hypothetical protein
MQEWVRVEGAWWATSFVFHMLLMCVLMLIGSGMSEPQVVDDDAPVIQEAKAEATPPPQLDAISPLNAPLDPTILTTESLTWTKPGTGSTIAQEEIHYDDSPTFEPEGGGSPSSSKSGPTLGGDGGYDVRGLLPGGPAVTGRSGVGIGLGEGEYPGSGGKGTGFGARKGHRNALVAGGGGTPESERAVAAALSWLARHQLSDGSSSGHWSLHDYQRMCKGTVCSGPGNYHADAGATAMGLLPFLAAGQNFDTKGPYQQVVWKGLKWLMDHQTNQGDLSAGSGQPMYSHGLATITLCEACGMATKNDRVLREKAQRAVNFILSAQNASTGGWRYTPGEDGDTSVVGWQVMALKSAQMAGLSVNPKAFEGAKQFLRSCSQGNYGGIFWYQPQSRGPS